MDVSEFSGRKLYTGLRLDYRFRLWAPTSCAISVVADLLVQFVICKTAAIKIFC